MLDLGAARQQQADQIGVTVGAGQRQRRVVVAVGLRVQLHRRVDWWRHLPSQSRHQQWRNTSTHQLAIVSPKLSFHNKRADV